MDARKHLPPHRSPSDRAMNRRLNGPRLLRHGRTSPGLRRHVAVPAPKLCLAKPPVRSEPGPSAPGSRPGADDVRAVVRRMKNHTSETSTRTAADGPTRAQGRPREGRLSRGAGPPPERPRMSKKKLIEESRALARHHQRPQAERLQAAQGRGRDPRQLPPLLQPGLPRVPQVGHRGRRVRGHRVERQGLVLRGHHRARASSTAWAATASTPPGINHPKIVRAVKSQLERMPLSSQELLDPLRGALAELLGRARPGRPPGLLLHHQRHRRRRRGDEAGPPLHRQARLHLLRARVPRQVLRLALPDGQGRVPPALRAAAPGRLLRALRRRRPRSRRSSRRPSRWACRSPGWWPSPCRARRARSCRPTTTGRACGRSARATACC